MPYTTNPHLPRLRMQAAKLVLNQKWSTREVARHTGFNQSTITRWVIKARMTRRNTIPTESSRPHHHPKELSSEMIIKILDYRQHYQRCAEVLHHLLIKDGYIISLSSVKRVLRRFNCSRYSKWKKWHQYPKRPLAEKPGILVQIDTVWDGVSQNRLYLYTLLDVCSRWSYVYPTERISAGRSVNFIYSARQLAPFRIKMLQSDHGSEFSKWFTKQIQSSGLSHRHSRVRTPTDNGHLERFNRTIQEECIERIPRSLKSWRKEIPKYLHYYNSERPHMALNMKTPLEVMRSY
ncbi:MAG: integrase core domain-containing protein [Candidatus Doudnabacteria bacterium]